MTERELNAPSPSFRDSSTLPGYRWPPSFAVAAATMTAVRFETAAINLANRGVTARTTDTSRS
jgi:hypothetical protein